MSISTFQNQSPYFLLPSLFWKLSQHLGQDQQNSKQIYCQLPIIIFLWTPTGFISPGSFLNFLLNLYIPLWLRKSLKFIVLRLLQVHLWVKNWICLILLMPPSKTLPQIFIVIPQANKNCPFLPNSIFWRYVFLNRERGEKIV